MLSTVVTHLCATFLFLPHFDVTCDLLLKRHTETWNLFVKFQTAQLLHHDHHLTPKNGREGREAMDGKWLVRKRMRGSK